MKSVELEDKTLVEIDDETMTFELDVEVSFLADVSYDSLEFAVFDREDDRYYNVEREKEEVDQNVIILTEIHISYQRDTSGDLLLYKIIDFWLDPHNSINTNEIDSRFHESYH
ncbi:MAG: hypothetical protein AAF383_05540 [Cyanobacteria bacterium P01_A01_bin.83]